MKTAKKLSGVALAATAATLLSVAPLNVSAHEHSADKCVGGNSCKGQSFCHTASTSCAGMNSCKGQGWIKATKEECEAKGGKLEEEVRS
jgi:hypothetical protein